MVTDLSFARFARFTQLRGPERLYGAGKGQCVEYYAREHIRPSEAESRFQPDDRVYEQLRKLVADPERPLL
jgi:hypothetical protein